MSAIWGWFFLSYYDVGGVFFFSREFHDLFLTIYGTSLGIDSEDLPLMLAKVCIFDSFMVFGLVAFWQRAAIINWWQDSRQSKLTDKKELHSD
jgi:hypothetical protein